MPPNGYTITESVPGFEEGDVLNVTERFRHWHRDRMVLECIGDTPGAERVVVVDEPTGFSERDILDETARFGDWHRYDRTFDAGATTLGDPGTEAATRITMATLSSIADPISG